MAVQIITDSTSDLTAEELRVGGVIEGVEWVK